MVIAPVDVSVRMRRLRPVDGRQKIVGGRRIQLPARLVVRVSDEHDARVHGQCKREIAMHLPFLNERRVAYDEVEPGLLRPAKSPSFFQVPVQVNPLLGAGGIKQQVNVLGQEASPFHAPSRPLLCKPDMGSVRPHRCRLPEAPQVELKNLGSVLPPRIEVALLSQIERGPPTSGGTECWHATFGRQAGTREDIEDW